MAPTMLDASFGLLEVVLLSVGGPNLATESCDDETGPNDDASVLVTTVVIVYKCL
jgi:hypothetical protein